MAHPQLSSRMVPLMSLLLLLLLLVTVMTSTALAETLTVEDVRQNVLRRIASANDTLQDDATGARSLQSYRRIDPYIIADLLTGIAFVYDSIVSNYPKFVLYDAAELQLVVISHSRHPVEFNFVKRF